MSKLVNATGKHPLVPCCPSHTSVALIPEQRQGVYPNTNPVVGFWRCPIDNKVYVDETALKLF
jgi:hypothetical protein